MVNKLRIARYLSQAFLYLACIAFVITSGFAQGGSEQVSLDQEQLPQSQPAEPVVLEESLSSPDNVTLDFKDADILNVLKIVSYKSGVNIVTTPEVMGSVTLRLVDVPWEEALDIILKTYGFSYQRQGNIILVAKLENIVKIQAEEPLQTEIFTLKFLDAGDAQKVLLPLLSSRGKISVLYTHGQKGWQFGTFNIGRGASSSALQREVSFEPTAKSKILVVTDTASSLDKVRNVILPQIDKKPKQVLIEARIIEVNLNKLRDIGFDWGTGSSGASGFGTPPGDLRLNGIGSNTLAGRNLASEFTPSAFSPLEGTAALPGTYPYRAGLEILFKKLTGAQFEVILHALEEDASSNTLSAPRILTLDNQEASMLVGYHTPILTSTVTAGSATTGPTQTQTLDYYQEIGIRLNVVPQISQEGYINMIIHPSVTTSTSSVTATNVAGATNATAIRTSVDYPIIDVREAQTQILMKDGETIVLGGMLKDVKTTETIGIPFISKIPLLGNLFKREIIDTGKIDLLIFITARVLPDEQLSPDEVAKIEDNLGKEKAVVKKATAKKRNNR